MAFCRPRVAAAPAPRPRVAQKASDEGEDTPAGQIPWLQVTWTEVQGGEGSAWLVLEAEGLLA